MNRAAIRAEQLSLADRLRTAGLAAGAIGGQLRERYGVNARQAQRLARGWTQERAAAEWSTRWPDEPKTFKNISYWESWPGPTGHAPSLVVLDRLAQLYACDVTDLVADWGTHAPSSGAADLVHAELESWAWQVQHLSLPELTRSAADWAQRLPAARRRAALLRLSAAAAGAAGPAPSRSDGRTGGPQGVSIADLGGRWTSTYRYVSSGRGELENGHHVEFEVSGGRLIGRSESSALGTLELDLGIDGLLATGSWTERTAADGYYAGAVFHGVIQLVIDPAGRSMRGRWLGPDRDFVVDSGPWTFERERSDGRIRPF